MKFPSHWNNVSLGEAGVWRSGSTPSKGHLAYWTDGTIPWVSPKDMKAQRITAAQDYITKAALESTSIQLIPPGALLFVTRSGILARTLPIAETSVEVVINQDIKALILNPEFDPEYVRYQLAFREQEILSKALKLGTTVQSVDFTALKSIHLHYPPLMEQRQIAESLSDLQEKIRKLDARLDASHGLIDTLRQKVISYALGGNVGKTKSKGDWTSTTLSEIAEIRSGIALGKRYDDATAVELPYVRVANVQRGHLALDDIKKITIPTKDVERYRLYPGDILMNEGGDKDKLGRGWVWEGQIEECVHQNHVFCVRLFDKTFPPEYISMYVNELGRDFFLREGTQTTNLASISKSKLGKFPLCLPTSESAKIIIEDVLDRLSELQSMADRIALLKTKLKKIELSAFNYFLSGRQVYRTPLNLKNSSAPATLDKQETLAKKQSPKRMKTTINDLLHQWPEDGMTFDSLWAKVPLEYDQIKESLFLLLSGDAPALVQTFDKKRSAIIFYRAKA